MEYKEFEKAVDILGILTRVTRKELKQKYLKMSKKYHPDMPEGSEQKFKEIKEAYDLLSSYMESYSFLLIEEDFKQQFPAFTNYKNWNR